MVRVGSTATAMATAKVIAVRLSILLSIVIFFAKRINDEDVDLGSNLLQAIGHACDFTQYQPLLHRN